MKKNTTKKSANAESHKGAGLTVLGVSLAGLAAAYFFLGPNSAKRRKTAKAWAIKMKGDVVEKLEKAGEMTEPVYHKIVDTVADGYKKRKKAGQEEIDELSKDLKKHWKTISGLAKTKKKA